MKRRSFLALGVTTGVVTLAGCASAPERTVRGQIDLIGHHTVENSPFYTFGDVSADGQWGVIGSYPTSVAPIGSTLVDLSTLADPTFVHELASIDQITRTNDVKFDPLRDGLYYRSLEPDQDGGHAGIEVVDFGYEAGTPDDPVVLARLETPQPGVHKFATHATEPLLYVVDMHPVNDVAIRVADVGDPAQPTVIDEVGPRGACHHVEYDPTREVIHAAFIAGSSEGYVIYDTSAPRSPSVLGEFSYSGESGYTEIGSPGFDKCHQAHPDPERDLAVIGDEIRTGIPGGKHVFDIGWGAGSLEDPQPIGFTHSPDAREMAADQEFWWTTHFHDVVYDDGVPLLVDGGYRQGAWVCDLDDPEDPQPAERFATTNRSADTPPPELFAWGAVTNQERDFVFVTDSYNGAFTFEVSAGKVRGDGGPDSHYDTARLIPDEED